MTDPTPEVPATPPRRRRRRLAIALVAIGLALACLPAYVSAYTITGPSEAPTLLLGDRVIVLHAAYDLRLPYTSTRIARLSRPRRGDLVAFAIPERGGLGIKRVVAVGGDTVELRGNVLAIDGRPVEQAPLPRSSVDRVPESHAIGSVLAAEAGYAITYTPGLSTLGDAGPTVVPEGSVYLLGDHRDNSFDSRTFGPIGLDRIAGRVVASLPTGPRRPQGARP